MKQYKMQKEYKRFLAIIQEIADSGNHVEDDNKNNGEKVLAFWREKAEELPLISTVAVEGLLTTYSTSDSERDFSKFARYNGHDEANLSEENVIGRTMMIHNRRILAKTDFYQTVDDENDGNTDEEVELKNDGDGGVYEDAEYDIDDSIFGSALRRSGVSAEFNDLMAGQMDHNGNHDRNHIGNRSMPENGVFGDVYDENLYDDIYYGVYGDVSGPIGPELDHPDYESEHSVEESYVNDYAKRGIDYGQFTG